jgi:hypothetical protein
MLAARRYGKGTAPVHNGLNWTMPALVNKRLGSSLGIRDIEGTMV